MEKFLLTFNSLSLIKTIIFKYLQQNYIKFLNQLFSLTLNFINIKFSLFFNLDKS